MNWLKNLSLKFKLLILLVLLTSSMLIIYGVLIMRDFEHDKIAYVLDSNRSHSQAVALQLKTEIKYTVEQLRFLMKSFNAEASQPSPFFKNQWEQQKNIVSATFWRARSSKSAALPIILKAASRAVPLDAKEISQLSQRLMTLAEKSQVAVSSIGVSDLWMMVLKFKSPTGTSTFLTAVLNQNPFRNAFGISQLYDSYLIYHPASAQQAQAVVSPFHKSYALDESDTANAYTTAVQNIAAGDGVTEFHDQNSKTWFISSSSLGLGDLRVLSFVPKSAALEAIYLIAVKSVFFLLFLFCVTVSISVLASARLTKSLRQLLLATRKISDGEFNFKVPENTGDEIGSLGKGFNHMGLEIERLLTEVVEKTRMESELKTAKLVQSTLLPVSDLLEGPIEIRGYFCSASECSGDWWHYQKIGENILFCIGDATGHGVPAALLTSAARSAASTLEMVPGVGLKQIIEIFNRAIYNTARGEMLMTFFLGLYSPKTQKLEYINASHEPPMKLHSNPAVTKSDIGWLNEVISAPLGRDPEWKFESASVQLERGDRLLVYTDGLPELQNAEGKSWGERSLTKCFLSGVQNEWTAQSIVQEIAKQSEVFRNGHALHDDVTYFVVAFNGDEKQVETSIL